VRTAIRLATSSEHVEAATFESVYEAELAYVWHTLKRLGVSDAEREDLAHDVFMVVHRRLHTYDSERPLRPWLFGIAFRVVSDYRRSARVRREVLDSVPAQRAASGPAPDERRIADDRRRLVLAALAELPLDRRAVFVMFELDGVAMADIADSLSIPRNTCYSHLRRGRKDFAAAVHKLQAREETR